MFFVGATVEDVNDGFELQKFETMQRTYSTSATRFFEKNLIFLKFFIII